MLRMGPVPIIQLRMQDGLMQWTRLIEEDACR